MKTHFSFILVLFVALFVNGCFIAVAPSVSANSPIVVAPLFNLDIDSDTSSEQNISKKQQKAQQKQKHKQRLAYNYLLKNSPYASQENLFYLGASTLLPQNSSRNAGGSSTISDKHIISVEVRNIGTIDTFDYDAYTILTTQYKYPYDLSSLPVLSGISKSLSLNSIQSTIGLQYTYSFSSNSQSAVDTISLIANLGAKKDNLYGYLEFIGIPSSFTLTSSFLAFLTPRNQLGVEAVYYSSSGNAYLSPHYSFITEGGNIWRIARFVSDEFDLDHSPLFVQFEMVK